MLRESQANVKWTAMKQICFSTDSNDPELVILNSSVIRN